MIQIRSNCFETNSSSTHSITICSKKQFDDWKAGKCLFNVDSEKFVVPTQIVLKSTKRKQLNSTNDSKTATHILYLGLCQRLRIKKDISMLMLNIVLSRNEIITTVCLMTDTRYTTKRVVSTLKSSSQLNMETRLLHSVRAGMIVK